LKSQIIKAVGDLYLKALKHRITGYAHFIADLTSLPKTFLLVLWRRLLPHAQATLNILRQSHVDPAKSTHEYLFGAINYNNTPILPPGLRIVLHEKPSQRRSWDPRGTEGWYLGPDLQHYRCHRVYCCKKTSERNTETITVLSENNSPTVYLPDASVVATEKLSSTCLPTSSEFGKNE